MEGNMKRTFSFVSISWKKNLVALVAIALALLVSLSGMATAAVIYNAGDDLTTAELSGVGAPSLPVNGVWTYGTSPTVGGAFTPFPNTFHTDSDTLGDPSVFQGWSPPANDSPPFILVNTTNGPASGDVVVNAGIGNFDSHTLWVHPVSTPSPIAFLVLRWTAPSDGTIDITADWIRRHFGSVTTHVRKNGVLLGADGVTFSGNPAVNFVQNNVSVSANDTIDFITGPNGNYSADSTQLNAVITFTAATTADAGGEILVSELNPSGPGSIIKVDPVTGAQTTLFSGGSFVNPTGMALDGNGNLLVADIGLRGIIKVDSVTGMQTIVSSGGFFSKPRGLAIDSNGDILVADENAFGFPGAIIKVDPVTGAQTVLTKSADGPMFLPIEVEIDSNGDLLVTIRRFEGSSVGGIIKVNPVTGAQTILTSGSLFVFPVGLAIGTNGDIFVADFDAFGGPGGVIKVDPATGAQTAISSGGMFVDPVDVKVNSNGDLLVLDLNAFGGPGGVIKVDPATGTQMAISYGGLFVEPVALLILSSATADAGPDQTVDEGDTVNLDGTGSSPDPGTLNYAWSQVGIPSVTLVGAGTATPSFIAPEVTPLDGSQTLTFQLIVDDGTNSSDPDTVNITVNHVNKAPIADAGADMTVEQQSPAGSNVTLNGAGSSDPDGDPLSFAWTGPFVGTATGDMPTVPIPAGANTVTLVVNDGTVNSAPDMVSITVQDTIDPSVTPPADITVDQTAELTPVNIDIATATDAVDPTPTISNDAPAGGFPVGTTQVEWMAMDAAGNVGTAFQQVTVNPVPEVQSEVLVDLVDQLNIPAGTSNSLIAKLNTALDNLNDGNSNNDPAVINNLQSFINAVQAQSGKKIPVADANVLIASAQAIIDLLNNP
jgi:K319-like protein/NHL repeat-containing protein